MGSNFIPLQLNIWLFQYHLLRRLSFTHIELSWNPSWKSIDYKCEGFVCFSGLSILLHWCTCIHLCQNHTCLWGLDSSRSSRTVHESRTSSGGKGQGREEGFSFSCVFFGSSVGILAASPISSWVGGNMSVSSTVPTSPYFVDVVFNISISTITPF